nr:MAG TPA: hypothetical protein [Caudoviricetes sp.]
MPAVNATRRLSLQLRRAGTMESSLVTSLRGSSGRHPPNVTTTTERTQKCQRQATRNRQNAARPRAEI